jgi:hypothetical protein
VRVKTKRFCDLMEEKSADGLVGCLIFDLSGRAMFRVYDDYEKGNFVDYEIKHHDLKIKIKDKSAYIKIDGDECYLDYSEKVIGRS